MWHLVMWRVYRPVSDECRTWLSTDVVSRFREWRKWQGLPPIPPRRKGTRQHSMAEQGKRRRKQIRDFLADGPKTTIQIAEHLGLTPEAIKHQLKRLVKAGEVMRSGKGRHGVLIWQLAW